MNHSAVYRVAHLLANLGLVDAEWHGFTQLKLVACIFFNYPKQCRHLLLSKRATLVSNLIIRWQQCLG